MAAFRGVCAAWGLAALVFLAACGPGDEPSAEDPALSESPESPASSGSPASTEAVGTRSGDNATATARVPEPEMDEMEPRVAERLRQVRSAVFARPDSADAWGRLGMVCHAHELWACAETAYREAQALGPLDERWHYYLGDVLSVVGTDLAHAERAFRRALELYPDYAPAHLRLGRVLVAKSEPEAAEKEFERALELDPDLQPARVALAQLRLAAGDLDSASELLEAVLAKNARHQQALSTLGQVRMRQGRSEEARRVAARAREAAEYNLFSDPLMGSVVAEGVSSVLIWERAKAFFDNRNFEQAARGLELVVELQPENADAHHQLAVSYRNLDRDDLARRHLETVVELDPERVDPLVLLASAYLEEQRPVEALPLLERALELAPEDPDAPWLLGRAQVLAGRPAEGIATFEAARAASPARTVPPWAHNEWGSALAQSGRLREALEHFQKALAHRPDDAQTLFYLGLVHEGLGRVEEAVDYHCRSMAAQPNPPAAGRLQALGRTCG